MPYAWCQKCRGVALESYECTLKFAGGINWLVRWKSLWSIPLEVCKLCYISITPIEGPSEGLWLVGYAKMLRHWFGRLWINIDASLVHFIGPDGSTLNVHCFMEIKQCFDVDDKIRKGRGEAKGVYFRMMCYLFHRFQ